MHERVFFFTLLIFVSSSGMNYTAVLVGGTGAVGGSVLKELLNSTKCKAITSIGRKEISFPEGLYKGVITQ